MASTVYYGKSESAGNSQVKNVKLQLTDEEITRLLQEANGEEINLNNLLFKSGDELIVHFLHANTIDSPSLILSIDDANEEVSIATDTGKQIFSTSPTPAVAGAWDSGEIVSFIYTLSQTTIGSSNQATWVMVDGALANKNTYGVTKLADTDIGDEDAESAITVRGVKNLIQNIRGNQLLYTNISGSEQVALGTIQLLGDEVHDSPWTIYGPAPAVITSTDITSGLGYIPYNSTNPNHYVTSSGVTSITASAPLTGGTITGTGTISLATSGVTAGNYGPPANNSPTFGGSFAVPYFTVDAYGRVTSASTKTITLPTVPKVASQLEVMYFFSQDLCYNDGSGNTSRILPTIVSSTTANASNMTINSNGNVMVTKVLSPSHVYIECPRPSGWTPVGVVGWNVSDPSTSGVPKHPGSLRVWATDVYSYNINNNGSVPCFHIQGTNTASSTNYVKIRCMVLYAKNS